MAAGPRARLRQTVASMLSRACPHADAYRILPAFPVVDGVMHCVQSPSDGYVVLVHMRTTSTTDPAAAVHLAEGEDATSIRQRLKLL